MTALRDSPVKDVAADARRPLPIVITKKQLRLMVPYTPQHILRLEKRNKFPRRIRIGPRRVGWYLAEIEAWLASCERR